jgi:hypothetical protein
MACDVLADRAGQPACGIRAPKGRGTEHAITKRAVRITQGDAEVVLTYANGAGKRPVVKASIESLNGENFRCWRLGAVREAHREDLENGKKRSYAHLKGFIAFAKEAGFVPVVLANYIIEKSP